MEGNEMNYTIRLTFSIVHGILLTLISFSFLLLIPSFTESLFSFFGFILLPLVSLFLTVGCNACVEYIAFSKIDIQQVMKGCWIPPLGIFCITAILYPLEIMKFSWVGPMNTLTATAVVVNGFLTSFLQLYVSRGIQADARAPHLDSSEPAKDSSSGDSSPR